LNNTTILLPIFFPAILAIFIAIFKFEEKERNIFVSVGVILNFIFIVCVFKYIGESKILYLSLMSFWIYILR
jgi:multicomponent Na+:H+ antiporter subunit D